MNLIDHFPSNYVPRPAQIEILQQIQQALQEDNKFIVVQCPTGVGKSHIAATLVNHSKSPSPEYIHKVRSNIFFTKKDGEYVYEDKVEQEKNGAYILTTTKYLQNQYEAIFQNIFPLKGKQNYRCNVDNTYSVNVAPCVLTPKLVEDCTLKSFCSYYNAMNDMLCSKFRITNYSKYLTLPRIAKFCDILICDEASEIEDTVVNYFSVTLNYKKLIHLEVTGIKPLMSDKPGDARSWLEKAQQQAQKSYEIISDGIKNTIHSKNYIQGEVGRLTSLRNIIDQIQIVLDTWSFCKYIAIRSSEGLTVTPLHIDKLTETLFQQANKVIFLSSTIYDSKCFTKTLGIKQYKYIEHPGVFDSNKSPIYSPCKVNLNYNNMDQALPIIVKQIKDICEMYPKVKGVIHTHTNAITVALQKHLGKNNRLLFKTNHLTNEHILFDHKNSPEATVLVSPSLAFGIDLPDDLCRFQIIVKLPYPSLGDKRISELAKQNTDWYQSKMFTKLIQMTGRGTRNEFDHCDTFVLDGNFVRVGMDNWGKLPIWFRNRLK